MQFPPQMEGLVFSLLAAGSGGGGSGIVQLAIFALIPIAMYFLLIRPQRRRAREATNLQSSIEIGDEVMTTSGVYGFVTGFEGDVAWLEIDDNVQIRISRAAIQRKVDTSGAAAIEATTSRRSSKADDDDDDDDDEDSNRS